MNQPDTNTAPVIEPETRSVLKPDIVAILGVGVVLIAVLLTATSRIESQIAGTNARFDSTIAEPAAERRAFRAEAAADRRAADAKMDEFRSHMQRLNERQARLEGQREGGANR